MISAAAQEFNRSSHQLNDLVRLAEQSPAEAADYLTRLENVVEQRPVGAPIAAVIETMLNQAGSLVDRVNARRASLGRIFPDPQGGATAIAQAQVNGATSVGFNETIPAGELTSIQGRVALENGVMRITTADGRVFNLAESNRRVETPYFGRNWMLGMIDDGPIQIRGTFGADGVTFNAEDYALNLDGRYDTFVSGRVEVGGGDVEIQSANGPLTLTDPSLAAALQLGLQPTIYVCTIADSNPTVTIAVDANGKPLPDQPNVPYDTLPAFDPQNPAAPWAVASLTVSEPTTVTVTTARGSVEITDPQFRLQLAGMPRLGVILPGDATALADGTTVYTMNPEKYFGLGRFRDFAIQPANAEVNGTYLRGDMAYSIFQNLPIVVPADVAADRVGHGNRLWLEGAVVLGADQHPAQFRSTYVGKRTDIGALSGAQPDANQLRADALSLSAGVP